MERNIIRIPDLIQKKRDKHELDPDEIRFFIAEMVKGCIEQVQLGKFFFFFKYRLPINYMTNLNTINAFYRGDAYGLVLQRNVSHQFSFSFICAKNEIDVFA